jgi:hypothetical protein
MRYIDDINNIRPIYITFCEYVESKSNTEKDALIRRFLLLNDLRYNGLYTNRTTFKAQLQDADSRLLFRNFMQSYISLNTHLRVYEDQLINIEFDSVLFSEELKELRNNISCLK